MIRGPYGPVGFPVWMSRQHPCVYGINQSVSLCFPKLRQCDGGAQGEKKKVDERNSRVSHGE